MMQKQFVSNQSNW